MSRFEESYVTASTQCQAFFFKMIPKSVKQELTDHHNVYPFCGVKCAVRSLATNIEPCVLVQIWRPWIFQQRIESLSTSFESRATFSFSSTTQYKAPLSADKMMLSLEIWLFAGQIYATVECHRGKDLLFTGNLCERGKFIVRHH